MEVCPTHSELENYVRTNKWYALGLQLGIEDNELKTIEKHRGGNKDECRRAMFRAWLGTTSNPCRKELLNALRTKAVNEFVIAHEYENFFMTTPHPDVLHTQVRQVDVSRTQVHQVEVDVPSSLLSKEPKLDDDGVACYKISEKYRPQFEEKRVELHILITNVIQILKDNVISLEGLKYFLSLRPEFRDDARAAKSIEDAIIVVYDHTSLINTKHLQAVAKKFNLQEAIDLIKTFDHSIEVFCKTIQTQHIYAQDFMQRSHKNLLQSEHVKFVLEWEGDNTTLSDIQSLHTKAFRDNARHLMVVNEVADSSETTTAFIPFKEIDRQHLFKAMEDGFVESHITKAVIQGPARAGKTSLKSLILSLPYKELSTPCIQAPEIAVGTLSVNRFGKSKSGKCWTCVNNQDMEEKILAELRMIALKEEEELSSTISQKIPLSVVTTSVVSPHLEEVDQAILQNDHDNNVSSISTVTSSLTKEEEEAVALIQELFDRCSKGIKAQELSLHERWLYFTDCGGQIQFQKLLPAFLPCASALMLVINLAEDLSGPASTEMCLETGQIKVSEHSLKAEEILKQLLVMVNSSSQRQKAIIENDRILSKCITPPHSLSIMAIATHRDEYDGKSETIKDKEEKLRNILESVDGQISYPNEDQFKILHEVDGRKAKQGTFDDPVVEQIAFKLRDQAYIVKVPLKWHCFQTLIQKVAMNGCGVLNLSLCKVYGRQLGMSDEEVVSAIKFFHILNSMLYYPDSGADDIVFANIHCLIDIITELMVTVCKARHLNIYPNSDIKLLAMEGKASVDFIRKMKACSSILKSFPHFVEELLAIFQHLHIAVKVENNEDHFFIPALLPVCDTTDIKPFHESTTEPMLFYFKKGLPMGLFCSVIVHLLSGKWLIIRKRNKLNYSNFMIIEHLNMKGEFAIIETPDYIQLFSEFADDINKVRCAINKSVVAAVKGNLTPEPGFFCPCPDGPHNHIAVVAQDQPTLLRCCETNKRVEDTEGHPRLAWYGAVPERGVDNVQSAQIHSKMDTEFSMKRPHEDVVESNKKRKEDQHITPVCVGENRRHEDNYSDSSVKIPKLDIQRPVPLSSHGLSKPVIDMDSTDNRSAMISPNVLRSNHAELCRLLNGSESTLLSLTAELFAKEIIDVNIKIDVRNKGGFSGADTLLTCVHMKIEQNPEHLDIVQKALEKERFLDDIVKKMKKESSTKQRI